MSKPDLPFWWNVDEFNLRDAAYLWTNIEPENVPSHNLPPRQSAAARLISKYTGALLPVYFIPDPECNRRDPPAKTRVTRDELLAVAEKTGFQPSFLFPVHSKVGHSGLTKNQRRARYLKIVVEQLTKERGIDDVNKLVVPKAELYELCRRLCRDDDRPLFSIANASLNRDFWQSSERKEVYDPCPSG